MNAFVHSKNTEEPITISFIDEYSHGPSGYKPTGNKKFSVKVPTSAEVEKIAQAHKAERRKQAEKIAESAKKFGKMWLGVS